MKKILFVLLMSLGYLGVNAQQDVQFTQFFSNKLVFNPAYAGSRDALSMVAFHRSQWVRFPGAPQTQSFSIHSPLWDSKSNAGLSIINDKIGITRSQIINAAYAYRIDLGFARLSLGLQGQFQRRAMDWQNTNPTIVDDPSIPYGNRALLLPNAGAGFYFDMDNFYAGLSVPRLWENELNYLGNDSSQSLAFLRRHYFAMLGGMIPITEALKLKPAILIKMVNNAPVEADFNLALVLKDALWVGATYRTGDSFDVFVQYHFNNGLRAGYSFDYTLTRLTNYNSGSHEIMLGIDLFRKRRGFHHPRYF